ncbi:tRNA threonylcarbamoyladenosine dehydratase [Taibaiella sp. KBW10]|uniref:tRNA threonylcarbamoyladenosine dehydratase n=1 Tax=Taibaiella sp. KBW10 TaxID=2153357 RepID=UPI000F59839F|nr:tRNA threonylcarbamoyladenosine dehydratase [Taibaiella sp. KBW10]RQO30580.1 tRNA threonylcarbamoyladenosine dehydratase [Taibaiella sp. KBW10]
MQDKSWLSRTTLLIGDEALDRLINSHVMVVGLGGVGSYAAEFICRSGVGKMTIIDGDVVDPTNRNRQLPALATNHGVSKADIMAERLKAINPELELIVVKEFITPEKVEELLDSNPDYVIDAIDSFTPKATFIRIAHNRGIRFVSSMGAGGKLDPTRLQVTDISKTFNCPFAMKVRKRLKKYQVYKGVKVVFSDELPVKESLMLTDNTNFKKSFYGTISYVPAAFGGAVASVAIRDLMNA